MSLEDLEFQLAALRAEVMQLRTERGGAMPFEFRTTETPMAAYPEQYSRFLNSGVNESTEPVPGWTVRHVWAFACWANGDLNGIVMEPGDVWFGPISVTHWDDIDGASTTPGVTSGYPCAWLEVHVNTLDVSMVVGTRNQMEAALDETEQKTTMIVPLVETQWADGYVTQIKELHPGDVLIPRL